MTSIRNNKGKIEWDRLFLLWPNALPELMRVIDYGFEHHGEYNCRESIGTDKHEWFRECCKKSGIRHWIADNGGTQFDEDQYKIAHKAFEAWNALMALEYDLSKLYDEGEKS